MIRIKATIAVIAISMAITGQAQTFQLNADGYFNAGGTDVMAFSDFYPEGHQGGVCVIMNGMRIATNGDIRWIFTENNPMRALSTAAQLAGAARVLRGFNDALSQECIDIAQKLYQNTEANGFMVGAKLQVAVELYLTTNNQAYLEFPFLWQQTEYVLGGGSSHYMFLVLAASNK